MESINTSIINTHISPFLLHSKLYSLDCSRGELLLNETELQSLNNLLGEHINEWRFEQLPQKSPPPKALTKKKPKKPTPKHPIEILNHHEDESSISTDPHSSNDTSHTHTPPQTTSPTTHYTPLQQPQTLETWSSILSNIIEELCIHLPPPFNDFIQANDLRIAPFTHPLQPIGLKNILENINNKLYSKVLQAIDDIYYVFQCAFSYFDISTPSWMSTQETSQLFDKLFNMHSILYKSFEELLRDENTILRDWELYYKPMGNSKKFNNKINVKKNDKQGSNLQRSKRSYTPRLRNKINTQQTQSHTHTPQTSHTHTQPPTQQPSQQSPTHPITSTYSHNRTLKKYSNSPPTFANMQRQKQISLHSPIQEDEQRDFQNLLSELNQEQHYNLYNEYKNKAVWRTFDKGEIELDDRSTTPRIFRDMVMWCRMQLITSNTHTINYDKGLDSDSSSDCSSSSGDSENDSPLNLSATNSDYKLRY